MGRFETDVNYHEDRIESNRIEFRKQFEELKKQGCCNCGEVDNLELHHIIPLLLGGTNRPSNLVWLCNRCHKSAHGGRHISDYKNKQIDGRPRNNGMNPLQALTIYTKYIFGSIGRKEATQSLGLSKRTKIADTPLFKEYLKMLDVKEYKNRIDMINSKRCNEKLEEGTYVGYVEFNNGERQELYYSLGV